MRISILSTVFLAMTLIFTNDLFSQEPPPPPLTNGGQRVAALDVNIYPNPAKDWFIVSFSQEIEGAVDIHVLNTAGQLVMNKHTEAGQMNARTVKMNILDLPPGNYFVEIRFSGQVISKPIVKTH